MTVYLQRISLRPSYPHRNPSTPHTPTPSSLPPPLPAMTFQAARRPIPQGPLKANVSHGVDVTFLLEVHYLVATEGSAAWSQLYDNSS